MDRKEDLIKKISAIENSDSANAKLEWSEWVSGYGFDIDNADEYDMSNAISRIKKVISRYKVLTEATIPANELLDPDSEFSITDEEGNIPSDISSVGQFQNLNNEYVALEDQFGKDVSEELLQYKNSLKQRMLAKLSDERGWDGSEDQSDWQGSIDNNVNLLRDEYGEDEEWDDELASSVADTHMYSHPKWEESKTWAAKHARTILKESSRINESDFTIFDKDEEGTLSNDVEIPAEIFEDFQDSFGGVDPYDIGDQDLESYLDKVGMIEQGWTIDDFRVAVNTTMDDLRKEDTIFDKDAEGTLSEAKKLKERRKQYKLSYDMLSGRVTLYDAKKPAYGSSPTVEAVDDEETFYKLLANNGITLKDSGPGEEQGLIPDNVNVEALWKEIRDFVETQGEGYELPTQSFTEAIDNTTAGKSKEDLEPALQNIYDEIKSFLNTEGFKVTVESFGVDAEGGEFTLEFPYDLETSYSTTEREAYGDTYVDRPSSETASILENILLIVSKDIASDEVTMVLHSKGNEIERVVTDSVTNTLNGMLDEAQNMSLEESTKKGKAVKKVKEADGQMEIEFTYEMDEAKLLNILNDKIPELILDTVTSTILEDAVQQGIELDEESDDQYMNSVATLQNAYIDMLRKNATADPEAFHFMLSPF